MKKWLAFPVALVLAAIAWLVWPRDHMLPAEAALEVLPGAESVIVHSADLGTLRNGSLFRAATLPGVPVKPTTKVRRSRVTIGLTKTGVAGQATLHVYLNAKVRWRLTLAGGGLEQAVDFGSGRLSAIEFRAGAGRVDLALPRPDGTLPVSLTGGAGSLALHVPSLVPAKLSLDGNGSVGQLMDPAKVFSPTGWDGATDRLQLRTGGGIATITVDRG
jgi:hypothetical protein